MIGAWSFNFHTWELNGVIMLCAFQAKWMFYGYFWNHFSLPRLFLLPFFESDVLGNFFNNVVYLMHRKGGYGCWI